MLENYENNVAPHYQPDDADHKPSLAARDGFYAFHLVKRVAPDTYLAGYPAAGYPVSG